MSYLSNSAPSRNIEPDYKIGKLIPLLGSDKPGEVLATVAAIDRWLKATNRDWHDLAEALAGTDSAAEAPAMPDWQTAVSECLLYANRLTPREIGFLRNIRRAPRISAKQLAWLEDIWWQVRS
jgi:hypothetical protein